MLRRIPAFRNASIKAKIVFIVLAASAIILSLTAVLNLAQIVLAGRSELLRSLAVNSALLSEYCVVPLSFNDQEEASRMLARVGAIPGLRMAVLYDRQGDLFAEYNPKGLDRNSLGPVDSDFHRFGDGTLDHFHRIVFQDSAIGSLALSADTSHLRGRAVRYAGTLAVVFLALILVTYVLALRMQGWISKPILELAAAARMVSEKGDLSQRVEWGGQDEIGVLYDGYNGMLDQLQARMRERDRAEEAARVRQQQLLQAGKMVTLGTLVSGVAHEINNPNGYIMLNASLALKKWEDMEALRNASGMPAKECEFFSNILENVLRGSQRIDGIVKRLKEYYRKDQDGVAKEAVDLNAVASKAIEILDTKIRKATANFVFEKGAGLPQVLGRFQELEQVLINLIENACQALPDRERGITLRTLTLQDGSVGLEVRDEGVGILPENLERITDPFFTTKRESGGTGLGLSLAMGIVTDHGGRLKFSSTPGKGTTVTLQFPAGQVAAPA